MGVHHIDRRDAVPSFFEGERSPEEARAAAAWVFVDMVLAGGGSVLGPVHVTTEEHRELPVGMLCLTRAPIGWNPQD